MATSRKTSRPSIYFIMKHNSRVPYFKEIINLPILLGTEGKN